MMPGMDGFEVLRRIRADSSVPVLMLTARGDEADRVVGLELGRVRAVLRRSRPSAENERLTAGGIEANTSTREVLVAGRAVELTGLEFDILAALIRRAGRVVPRNALLRLAGRDDVTVGERTIDVHISKLRKKLGDDPRSPSIIRTVRGVGYTLARESE